MVIIIHNCGKETHTYNSSPILAYEPGKINLIQYINQILDLQPHQNHQLRSVMWNDQDD